MTELISLCKRIDYIKRKRQKISLFVFKLLVSRAPKCNSLKFLEQRDYINEWASQTGLSYGKVSVSEYPSSAQYASARVLTYNIKAISCSLILFANAYHRINVARQTSTWTYPTRGYNIIIGYSCHKTDFFRSEREIGRRRVI
jgi:hypothetical protein